jgi:hypothetical protein
MTTEPMEPLEAARQYVAAGFRPVPVPYRQKGPLIEGWQHLRLAADDLPKYFNGQQQNIGTLLGDDYGTTDTDLDCIEAVRVARFLMPATGMVFGRASKPASHWFFRMDPPHRSLAYKDIDGKMILELRCQAKDGSVGMQTVVPPSTHKTGETIRFESGCGPMPANIDADVLLPAVARTAAAALLARHWPARGQGRHDTMLALAGGLARTGWNEAAARSFCRAVYDAISNPDPKAIDRSDSEVEYTFRRMAESKEFTGWPHVIERLGERVVELATDWLGIRGEHDAVRIEERRRQQHEPQLSGNVAPWPAPMKSEAFYGLAGRFVEVVDPHTEADPSFLLLVFLAYAGNLIDRKSYVMAGGDAHFTNLYVCGVGPTSAGRKGSATAPVEMFFRDGDRAPGMGNMLNALASGEGLIWTIRDPVYGKQQNKKTRQIEDVLLHEGVTDKRLIVNAGEFMGVMQVARRQGNTLSPIIRSAWESGYLVSPTKNSPARSTGAHVTIIGNISREELLRVIEAVDGDSGLLNRFLWCCSRRSKALPEGGQMWRVVQSTEWRELQEHFNRISPRESRRMARDSEAADLWGRDSHPDRGVYATLSRERYGLAGAATARAHAQVLRLSLLYAVLDGADEIRREHLDAALAVWEYSEASARYIFGDVLGDPTADEILKALRAAATGLTRTDIRDHFRRNKQEGEITRALYLLHQKGLARFERQETGGRPIERWVATSRGGVTTKGS